MVFRDFKLVDFLSDYHLAESLLLQLVVNPGVPCHIDIVIAYAADNVSAAFLAQQQGLKLASTLKRDFLCLRFSDAAIQLVIEEQPREINELFDDRAKLRVQTIIDATSRKTGPRDTIELFLLNNSIISVTFTMMGLASRCGIGDHVQGRWVYRDVASNTCFEFDNPFDLAGG